jgi:hypothetical protein
MTTADYDDNNDKKVSGSDLRCVITTMHSSRQ